MLNKNSSAGTAAKKSSKCSWLAGRPLLAAILLLVAVLSGCSREKEPEILNGQTIAMPDYYRKITGYDSIQLVFGGRGNYDEAKQDYDVTWDSLYANFCYPNKWQFEKFEKDTVFIHDTIYTSKNYKNVRDVYIGGN